VRKLVDVRTQALNQVGDVWESTIRKPLPIPPNPSSFVSIEDGAVVENFGSVQTTIAACDHDRGGAVPK
jgi:hypothetical protein